MDVHWKEFPTQYKEFIYNSAGNFKLVEHIAFWSRPEHVKYTRGELAKSTGVLSWFLALLHMKEEKVKEGVQLLVNGSFLQQCAVTPIEKIRKLCHRRDWHANGGLESKLPILHEGIISTFPSSSESIIEFLQKKLSSDSYYSSVISQLSMDWKGNSQTNSKINIDIPNDKDQKLKIHVVDELEEEERFSLDIGASTSLKTLLNEYSEEKGVSLRSLRFSYDGKTLFLSSMGHKTPQQLGMSDGDTVTVTKLTLSSFQTPASSTDTTTTISSASNTDKTKTKPAQKCTSNKKKSKKKKNVQSTYIDTEQSMKELKKIHSRTLSLLFEEAEPKFNDIRRYLNQLNLERTPPKVKLKNAKAKKQHQPVYDPPMSGLGGKAGKCRFTIHVGEVENLYVTTKPSAMKKHAVTPTEVLDLHGCMRDEALDMLNQGLVEWYDAAMRGSYPWIKQVVIICGGGAQLLSETVERWIRETDKVSNAPKSRHH